METMKTQADQYRALIQSGMRREFAWEIIEYAAGRWKGDGYLPSAGEQYDPDPFGVSRMDEDEYLAFLQAQPALPEENARPAAAASAEPPVPVGAGSRS
jgi:hypothetical protein